MHHLCHPKYLLSSMTKSFRFSPFTSFPFQTSPVLFLGQSWTDTPQFHGHRKISQDTFLVSHPLLGFGRNHKAHGPKSQIPIEGWDCEVWHGFFSVPLSLACLSKVTYWQSMFNNQVTILIKKFVYQMHQLFCGRGRSNFQTLTPQQPLHNVKGVSSVRQKRKLQHFLYYQFTKFQCVIQSQLMFI